MCLPPQCSVPHVASRAVLEAIMKAPAQQYEKAASPSSSFDSGAYSPLSLDACTDEDLAIGGMPQLDFDLAMFLNRPASPVYEQAAFTDILGVQPKTEPIDVFLPPTTFSADFMDGFNPADDDTKLEELEELESSSDYEATTSAPVARSARPAKRVRRRKLTTELSAAELIRTREVNRIAAQRHRQIARERKIQQQGKFDALGVRNDLLRREIRDTSMELNTLRKLVISMYGPNGTRRGQLML